MISIYRPTKYQETYLRQTAYTTKWRKVIENEVTPENLWYRDLKDLIQSKQQDGHEVIIAGDFNDNLNDPKSITRVFMAKLGLQELMIANYGEGPATHIRGTKTIDGVFATSKIYIKAGKYCTFEQSPSDHRWIEIEITEKSLLGISKDDICPPMARKATSKIPSVKENFQQLVETQVKLYRLDKQMETLYQYVLQGKKFQQAHADIYEMIETRMQRAN